MDTSLYLYGVAIGAVGFHSSTLTSTKQPNSLQKFQVKLEGLLELSFLSVFDVFKEQYVEALKKTEHTNTQEDRLFERIFELPFELQHQIAIEKIRHTIVNVLAERYILPFKVADHIFYHVEQDLDQWTKFFKALYTPAPSNNPVLALATIA